MKAPSLALVGALAFLARCPAQQAVASTSAGSASASAAASQAASDPVITVDFSNPKLSPSHWTLTLHPDGSAHFRSQMGTALSTTPGAINTPDISRDVQLTSSFAASVFQTAQHHSFFNQECESHLKVAYQGDKTLSYSGPDGKGSCSFNYSRDRDIQSLGDNFEAVAETIVEGARLEVLLQHDPLGLDKEIESLSDAVQSGRAQQLCAIRDILERLAQDDHVLDLVRKRARILLARADT